MVLERDLMPHEGWGRTGVPQARHAHGLLAAGSASLERLFPGLRAELIDGGAPTSDFGEQMIIFIPSGRIPSSPAGLTIQTFSRDLLESRLRQRVNAIPNVHLHAGIAATALITGPSAGIVSGVTAVRRSAENGPGQPLQYQASLVVDCSGRFSKFPRWLNELGYPCPAETIVDCGIVYASRVFQGPPLEWQGLYQPLAACTHPRGVTILRIEGGRWLITLFGVTGHHPPADESGFLAFAAALDNPELTRVLDASRPASPIHQFTRTENRRRDLRRRDPWPDGFIVVGDAQCAFNPVYAQGMTVAADSALRLHNHLLRVGSDLTGFARAFQRSLRHTYFNPWLISTSEDRIWAAQQDRRANRLFRTMHWYKKRLLAAVINDAVVRQAFFLAFHAVRLPSSLANPRILVRVMLKNNRSIEPRRGAAPATTVTRIQRGSS